MKYFALLLAIALLPGLPGCSVKPEADRIDFVVMGDNRGGRDQLDPPAAFHEILDEVAVSEAEMVWNLGDMIYGLTNDFERVRAQWTRYRAAIARLPQPIFHVPGNHDVWDVESGRLYAELWGPAPYAVERGRFRFLVLDSERDPGRVGPAQREWLERELAQSGARRAFVFVHRPLFPSGSHRGTSLDADPRERDALHDLLVRHRDRIAAVFTSHEHLFHHERRDGVEYFITGGAGSELHAPPERGGFHHYLMVRARSDRVVVDVRKTGRAPERPVAARRLEPGEQIESWESGVFCRTWDYTVEAVRNDRRARSGAASLDLRVNFAHCGWPVLYVPAGISSPTAWQVEVFSPVDAPADLSVTPMALANNTHESPPHLLTQGWNRVRTEPGAWLPAAARTNLQHLQWVLTTSNRAWRGAVGFDDLQIEQAGRLLVQAGWEPPLLWTAWSEEVETSFVSEGATDGQRAVRLSYGADDDLAPMLIGKASPPLDGSAISALELGVWAPVDPPALALVVRSAEREYSAPPIPLKTGHNRMRFEFDGGWLPDAARRRMEQLAWRIDREPGRSGALVFDHLRAAGPEAFP